MVTSAWRSNRDRDQSELINSADTSGVKQTFRDTTMKVDYTPAAVIAWYRSSIQSASQRRILPAAHALARPPSAVESFVGDGMTTIKPTTVTHHVARCCRQRRARDRHTVCNLDPGSHWHVSVEGKKS